jgi:molecular chaperone GrpE
MEKPDGVTSEGSPVHSADPSEELLEPAADGAAAAEQEPESEPEPEDGSGDAEDLDPDVLRYVDAAVAADEIDGAQLGELATRAQQAGEYLELAQRTKADFENFRKRAARESAAAQDRGVAKLAKELLPAIDNLDRAVTAAEALATAAEPDAVESADAQLVSGIRLVHADVLAALARVGIEPFSPEGEPFDPQYHEAVAQTPVEGASSGTVVEVYQRGYRLGETVLRPARVLVAA